MNEFGYNLKSVRTAAGITQKDMSSRIGVAKSTYSLYESGKREPNVQMIKKIVAVLNISSDALLGIQNAKNPFFVSASEKLLVQKYRKLSANSKERVDRIIDMELDLETKSSIEKKTTLRTVQGRVRDNTVRKA